MAKKKKQKLDWSGLDNRPGATLYTGAMAAVRSAELMNDYNKTLEALKDMTPEELVNLYIEAKTGSVESLDAVPAEPYSSAIDSIQEIVDFFDDKNSENI